MGGSRRVRAARMAGLTTIPGFIRQDVDPYIQVIENLQRDDLLPMELAAFVIEREQAGDSRAEIARRLGKSASLITEVAELPQAPAPIRKAHDEGRCRDVRSLYLLVRTHRERPEAVERLLADDAPITREKVETLASEQRVVRRKPPVREGQRDHHKSSQSGSGGELLVEVDGQEATFDVRTRPSKTTAEVHLADGSWQVVGLPRLRLMHGGNRNDRSDKTEPRSLAWRRQFKHADDKAPRRPARTATSTLRGTSCRGAHLCHVGRAGAACAICLDDASHPRNVRHYRLRVSTRGP